MGALENVIKERWAEMDRLANETFAEKVARFRAMKGIKRVAQPVNLDLEARLSELENALGAVRLRSPSIEEIQETVNLLTRQAYRNKNIRKGNGK